MAYPKYCPYCKNSSLSIFDKSFTTTSLACSNCKNLFTVKTDIGKVLDVTGPILSVLVSLVALAPFFGITDFGKIKEWLSHKN